MNASTGAKVTTVKNELFTSYEFSLHTVIILLYYTLQDFYCTTSAIYKPVCFAVQLRTLTTVIKFFVTSLK